MDLDEECANHPQNRGLVRWTKRGSQLVQTQSFRTLNAVMDEQDRQWETGVDDFDRIAAVSQGATAVTIRNAKQLALPDEQEAMAIQMSEYDKEERDNLDNGAATKSTFAGGLEEDFFSGNPDIPSSCKKRSKRKSQSSNKLDKEEAQWDTIAKNLSIAAPLVLAVGLSGMAVVKTTKKR